MGKGVQNAKADKEDSYKDGIYYKLPIRDFSMFHFHIPKEIQ